MSYYTFSDIITDPEDPRLMEAFEDYTPIICGDNLGQLIIHVEDINSSLFLERIVDNGYLPFMAENGNCYPMCIIRKEDY